MNAKDQRNQRTAVPREMLLLLLIKPSSAAGGEGHSDKQPLGYKGGRKSIKLDNKIAIESLLLFIAAECNLM